jgi:hypothetical protein
MAPKKRRDIKGDEADKLKPCLKGVSVLLTIHERSIPSNPANRETQTQRMTVFITELRYLASKSEMKFF